MLSKSSRNPYLDFLRALAIVMVLTHHIFQAWPGIDTSWLPYTRIGAKGVDLFFVLSGWLIGGLFWRELKETGELRLVRFWKRRWLRTIPPYLGGLLLAWLAVWIYRQESFDWGYLIFVQNYYPVMPFFLVSWSLCIEEHFYLFVPAIFMIARRQTIWLAPLLVIMPLLFRWFEFDNQSPGFGYHEAATHLNADGLLLGFFAAYLNTNGLIRFDRKWMFFVSLIAVCAVLLSTEKLGNLHYIVDPLLYALLFLSFLLIFVHHPVTRYFDWKPIAWLAKVSYSIYLTHALVIHFYTGFVHHHLVSFPFSGFIVVLSMILVTGWFFHLVFERSAFKMRERFAPTQA